MQIYKYNDTIVCVDSFKQILENENLFTDSFATHLLASCNCANRNQIRQSYDHLHKSSSNHFWVSYNYQIIFTFFNNNVVSFNI